MWSEHANELLACRGCLVTDVKLHSIHENRLIETYEELVGIPIHSPAVYPQHLCIYCRSQLLKFLSFRSRCRKSQVLLRDTELAGKCITTQNVRTIDRHYYQLTTNYIRTKIEIVEFKENDEKLDNNVKQEDWIDDYNDDDNELYLTDQKIEINLEVDDNVNKEEKDSDSELEQPIAIFVEDRKRKKVTDIIESKKRNKKVRRKKERNDKDFASPLDLDVNFLPKSEQIKRDSDSELDKPIAIFVDDPKKVKRKRVLKNVIGTRNKEGKKLCGKRARSDEEIKEFANSLDFDVKFLDKDEQYREVEERKMTDLNDPLIIKCVLCGKNFRDNNTAATHHKNYHDQAAGHHFCEICSCRFKSNNKLLGHLRIHRVKFCCKICDFFTKVKCNLVRHYNWHQGKRQSCPYCERIFEKVSSYFSHIRLKHASELTWCDLCGESFIGEKGVKAHQKRAHKDVEKCEFKCKNCNTNFINKVAFVNHEKANRCDLSSCIKCGESFVSEQLLKYHLVQHHTRENAPEVHNLECERCKVKFQNAVALKRHGEVCLEGGFACVQCGVSFTTTEFLNEHMIEIHTLEHTFKCEECDKTFSNAYYFRDHYSKVHLSSSNVFDKGLMKMSRRVRPDREGKEKGHRAPRAKRRANKGEVDKSIRKWRVVGGEAGDVVMEKAGLAAAGQNKSAMCEVCGKSFMNSGLLKYHHRIHSGERPFECTQCPKSFTVKSVLMQHMRVHTGERPYPCKLCNKAFKSPSALYRHNLIHSGIRRHVCQLCDKSFQTSTCVKLHIKTVHMKLPMPPRNRRRNRLKED